MDSWITLLTFRHPFEAHLVKTKLESEGIQAFVQHEVTAQIIPYASEPATPVKLRIQEKHLNAAVKLLKEHGYWEEEKPRRRQSALTKSVDQFTQKVPGLRDKPLQLRVILAVAVVLVVITLVFSLFTLYASM
jgi:hypothetical protein